MAPPFASAPKFFDERLIRSLGEKLERGREGKSRGEKKKRTLAKHARRSLVFMMNFLIEIFLTDFSVLFASRRHFSFIDSRSLPFLSFFFFYTPLKFYLHAQIERADFDDEIVPACILANRRIVPTR